MSKTLDWECPHCRRPSTITDSSWSQNFTPAYVSGGVDNHQGIHWVYTVCPSPSCKKATLDVALLSCWVKDGDWKADQILRTWRLVPDDAGKVQPDYIPEPIRKDYSEACKIRQMSPNASATLSRRCLQGMIRDFWGVTDKATLKKEIDAIKDRVQPEVWDGIEVVRKMGNIGAHMDNDINVIVEVDTGEAEKLIGLIEILIEEWYVARYTRISRLESLKEIAAKKAPAK
jgi:hypothetical protein